MNRRRLLLKTLKSGNVIEDQKASLGDIAYYANGKVSVVSPDKWDASLGVAVGVVVIPSGFAPDGKARIVSLHWASQSSTGSTSASTMTWASSNVNTTLKDYNRFPSSNNETDAATDSSYYGYLPSDLFTAYRSFGDPEAYYYEKFGYYTPSPYLENQPNPAYYAPVSGYENFLMDFDGKGNTDVLVTLGADYVAANAARNYKAAGAEEIEWYLPAMGELGYLIVRFKKIQASHEMVGASQLEADGLYWSSSEQNIYAGYLGAKNGILDRVTKTYNCFVRPFAMLDF